MLRDNIIPYVDEEPWISKNNKEKEEVFEMIFKETQTEGKSVKNVEECYEEGFMKQLFMCFDIDPFLKKFYIRFVFECDNALRIINKLEKKELSEESFVFLEQTVENMKRANSYSELAMEDCIFHRWLFCAAGRGHFFNWYDSDSRDLKMVLDKFWENVRTKNIYYAQLISIHEKIVNHIKKLDRKKTIEELQHHFAIVLLQSLGIAQH